MMTRLLPATLALLLAACTSVAPLAQQPSAPPPPVPEPIAATNLTEAAREEVMSLLDAAADASPEEFADCEQAVLLSLSRWGQMPGSDPGFTALAGEVMDELDRLALEIQPAPVDVEPPPEPEPVAAERVALEQAKAREQRFDLPVVVNAEVASLVEYYTGPYRDRLAVALERASKLVPFIREELRARSMPEDLAWLPLVESAFNTKARSRAKAQGLWQFMAGTARLYGLRCDTVVDERNDPYLATKAAVAHLADLKDTFGDWELALAAYNSGAGRVRRALKRANGSASDFWSVRRHLPRETRNYVPALWAALLVAKNPTAYGLPVFEEKQDCMARVEVEGALDLEVLAERLEGVGVDELADLNPALTRRLTPAKGSYQLAVPCGLEQQVTATIASIPEKERVRRLFHTIRSGDTLSAIARRYGSSVEEIRVANGIRNPRALRIGQTLIIPTYPGTVSRPVRTASRSVRTASGDRYVVRRGDTLYNIARRFGTSVEQLKRRNKLGGSMIRPGQVLLMP